MGKDRDTFEGAPTPSVAYVVTLSCRRGGQKGRREAGLAQSTGLGAPLRAGVGKQTLIPHLPQAWGSSAKGTQGLFLTVGRGCTNSASPWPCPAWAAALDSNPCAGSVLGFRDRESLCSPGWSQTLSSSQPQPL